MNALKIRVKFIFNSLKEKIRLLFFSFCVILVTMQYSNNRCTFLTSQSK